MFVVVAYDVPALRTEVFRKLLTRYLTHEQNSVFMGRLTEGTYRRLLGELAKVLRPDERILTLIAENQNNIKVENLRKNEDNGALVVIPAERHDRGFDIL
jgi:CRISPR-associated protein Cas2